MIRKAAKYIMEFRELRYFLAVAREENITRAAELMNTYPGIHFHFYSGDAVDVAERLNHGSLDFAVMLEPIDNIKYNFASLPERSEWGILMKKMIRWQQKKL